MVDPTCRGIGRNPPALQRIARATGLNIVMGSGYYLQSSHPPSWPACRSTPSPTRSWPKRIDGIDGARIGLIGEIGVSSDFTPTRRSRCAVPLVPRRARDCR